MKPYMFFAAFLASTLLAQAALAEDQPAPPPSGAPDEYTLSVRQYVQGEIVGEGYYMLGSDLSAPVDMLRICSAKGGDGATAKMPVCYMLALNPAAQAQLKYGMKGRMRKSLQDFAQPPLREVRFNGWRIYFYFPNTDCVEFAFVRTPAGVEAIADGDWGGEFQGEVLDRLVVHQQAEPREAEPEEE